MTNNGNALGRFFHIGEPGSHLWVSTSSTSSWKPSIIVQVGRTLDFQWTRYRSGQSFISASLHVGSFWVRVTNGFNNPILLVQYPKEKRFG